MLTETAAVLGDFHAPYHDEAAVDAALSVLAACPPEVVFLNGDLVDFHSISRFEKDPPDALILQQEIDSAKSLLQRFRKTLPNAQLTFLAGNHEDRLRRFLTRTPELWPLEALRLDRLLDLESIDCQLVEGEPFTWRGWTICHGDVVRSHAGQTAQEMIRKYGTCGVSNHVHRLALVEKTNYTARRTWIENGCLAKLNPPYLTVADWQHGFSLLHFAGGKVYPELIPIHHGECFFQGLLFPTTGA